MHTFRAFDLETNGVDVSTCEVGQVAIETASCFDGRPVLVNAQSDMVYCAVTSMPAAASEINGLTVEGLSSHKPFGYKVRALVSALTAPGVVVVTFNGVRFDVPVVARYAAAHPRLAVLVADIEGATLRERFEVLLGARHVDVCRLWQVARAVKTPAPWSSCSDARWTPSLHARMFAGSLEAAHGFWEGCDFVGAHDASADNRATLAVLDSMLREGFVDLERAIRLTSRPLPGDVDFEGAFKWRGDQAICTLKKCRDIPIEKVDRGFLQWMLTKDFHRHTKQIVREFLAGQYPEREYENES